MSLIQAPQAVVMVRPWQFSPNPETAEDNAFQKQGDNSTGALSAQAREEFDRAVETLTEKGIRVHVFDDFGEKNTPDSVFPNNWFSTHPGGHVAIYPMYAQSRRRERRQDILEMLKAEYRVQDIVDFSGLEYDELYLEGTGAMVLDHINRIAYAALSHRCSEVILERFCSYFHFEPMAFATADRNGKAIYHTNVMMAVGTRYALICLAMISDGKRRAEVKRRLEESGREVIDLSFAQIDQYAGNALELTGKDGKLYLAMSTVAYASLTAEQKSRLESFVEIIPLAIPTIEMAGGSVRCTLAGVHLSRR